MVKMMPGASHNLQQIGYDEKKRLLYIRFIGNKLYRYQNVPRLFWIGLQLAESKGSFFAEWIVGHFQYEQIKEDAISHRS